MVIFAHHDLVKNPPYCNMDLISCRNLLIYMTAALQNKIYLMLLFGLKKNGYLFLGASENPLPIIQNMEVVNRKWKLYRKPDSNRVLHIDSYSLPELLDKKHMPTPFYQEDSSQNFNATLAEAVNNNLVSDKGWLVVCVDENNQVIKSYGDTNKYLLQKNFTLNLIELLPKPLSVAYNTLRKNALKTHQKVSLHEIKTEIGSSVVKVSLEVSPLVLKKVGQKVFMVTFREDRSESSIQESGTIFDEKIYLNQYTKNLEEEVQDLQEELQSAYEKLAASQDNLQSFTEELLSANEEMQSANEEMQSINEELHTLNADYQFKNKELQEVNDDLNNYFRSNVNGQLFVNKELDLIKFSPGTVKLINLLPTDIGRPLSNISTNFRLETIIEDIKQVLAEGNVITKEIETNEGKWYQLMTMPYIQQADNKQNGAIITFTDITELKKTQLELDKKNKILLRINADLDNFVYTASHDLLTPLNNIESSIELMNAIEVADPELKESLEIINLSIKQFQAQIKELSTIAKLESEMLAMELVDLNKVIDNIEWSLRDKIKLTGAVIKRELEVKHIYFAKKNLRSILFNLISNGIKFHKNEPPIVTVHTKKEGGFVVLSVQDNGRGIPKKGLEKVFTRYGRLHQDVEGQGIGLYLAKKMIDEAGGSITVESEPGEGTKFTIYFKDELES